MAMRSTLIAFIALVSLFPACTDRSADTSQAPKAAAPSGQAQAGDYYSREQLGAMGLREVKVDAESVLLCGGADESACVCLEPLPCAAAGTCANYDQNLAILREALAKPADGRTVSCQRSETGRCEGFRYLDFSGDIDRHEMRWFDASGALVGQRNWTDYPEYCGGRARTRFQGRVPRCASPAREELICGEAGGTVFAPADDLARRAGASARP
jgi:hypothetical protein